MHTCGQLNEPLASTNRKTITTTIRKIECICRTIVFSHSDLSFLNGFSSAKKKWKIQRNKKRLLRETCKLVNLLVDWPQKWIFDGSSWAFTLPSNANLVIIILNKGECKRESNDDFQTLDWKVKSNGVGRVGSLCFWSNASRNSYLERYFKASHIEAAINNIT